LTFDSVSVDDYCEHTSNACVTMPATMTASPRSTWTQGLLSLAAARQPNVEPYRAWAAEESLPAEEDAENCESVTEPMSLTKGLSQSV